MSNKSKEPTRHQLSSRLHYNAQVPAFLQKLQNRVAGVPDNDYEDDGYDEYGRDEYEHVNDGSGRPPIPRRPPIPERPADNPGSADEDEGDDDYNGPAQVSTRVIRLATRRGSWQSALRRSERLHRPNVQ